MMVNECSKEVTLTFGFFSRDACCSGGSARKKRRVGDNAEWTCSACPGERTDPLSASSVAPQGLLMLQNSE